MLCMNGMSLTTHTIKSRPKKELRESLPLARTTKDKNPEKPTLKKKKKRGIFRYLASIAVELKWITFLLQDIGIHLSDHCPQFLCDNMSSIHLVKNHVFHTYTKYIKINNNFI